MSPRFYVGQVVKLMKLNGAVIADGRLQVGDELTVRRIYMRSMFLDNELKRYRLQAIKDASIEFEVGELFMRNNITYTSLRGQISKLWKAIYGKVKSNGKGTES